MDEDKKLAGILRDLAVLARENADVRAGNLAEPDYEAHCNLVDKRIKEAFPSE